MSDDRICRAYQELVGDLPSEFAAGAVDLRPAKTAGEHMVEGGSTPVILAGIDDLIELRETVERVTGPGTWPFGAEPRPTWALADEHTVQVPVQRPAQLMRFVMAFDHLLPDNSAAWRTRKTMLEALGLGLGGLNSVTAVARRFEPV